MPLVAEHKNLPLSLWWTNEAVDRITPGSQSLPPGVRVAVYPKRADRTAAAHKAAIGYTHHYDNPSAPDNSYSWTEKALMDNCEGFYGQIGAAMGDARPNPLNATEQQVRNAVNAVNSGTKAHFYTEEAGEKLNHQTRDDGRNYNNNGLNQGLNITDWNTSNQSLWFAQQMAQNVRSAGGEHYGGYDGIIDVGTAFFGVNGKSLNDLKTGLGSNSAAYSACQSFQAFANGYFLRDEGAFRGGCMKMYAKGDDQRERWVFSHLIEMMLVRKARTHKGWTGRVAAVFWPGFDERLGKAYDGIIYQRTTPTGGTVSRGTSPIWNPDPQIFLQAVAILLGFDTFNWTIPSRFGANPGVAYPNAANGGNPDAGVQWSGNVGPSAVDSLVYTTSPVAYPYDPQGSYDIPAMAIHLAHFIYSYANGPLQYASVSVNGGAATNTAETYLVDRYESDKIVAFYTQQGNNRSLLVWDGNAAATNRQITVSMNGVSHTFKSYGQYFHASRHTV